ncbi:hypothetical protein C9J12_18235 [Photobacterium frigidiphilum]|uniref:Uncharacterized protein n=1 Tax=Photobacterium frigidiphilum TaxID=264736 RepID=A0A2T3JCN1_9GAMM|nr:hypothetical protein [Photobacterium frigidiphilum]PSU46646.1 hypothetical protein C9J12_18235 [Photobacterium frigidiphilum]
MLVRDITPEEKLELASSVLVFLSTKAADGLLIKKEVLEVACAVVGKDDLIGFTQENTAPLSSFEVGVKSQLNELVTSRHPHPSLVEELEEIESILENPTAFVSCSEEDDGRQYVLRWVCGLELLPSALINKRYREIEGC